VIAVGLTLALFLFWTGLGFGVTAALLPRRNPLQNLLLAPVVGLGITVLSAFLLNRLGIPIGTFGPWLAAALLVAGAALLIWRRPETPWRRYGPFAGVFLLALVLTGRPLLEFGFDWLSFCNDDMANYCIGAQRLHDHGFGDVPDKDELLSGRDYTLGYWFMHVPADQRAGSETVVAWVMSCTGLSPHQAFMPVIVVFYLLLLSAAGALVCQSQEAWGKALLTTVLLALSALTTLGVVYQLIAQVAGLSLLTGCAVVLMRPYRDLDLRAGMRLGALAALVMTPLLLVYPEVFPFLLVGFACYLFVAWRKKELAWRPLAAGAAGSIAILLLLLNSYASVPLSFFFMQLTHFNPQNKQMLMELFPYFLIPSGPAHLWGLAPIGGDPSLDAQISVKILLGMGLLAAGCVAAAVTARRGEPAGIVAAVMLVVGVVLLVRCDAYGLFKMAMFLQPFLLGAAATAWCSLWRWRLARVAPLVALGLLGASTQMGYTEASRGLGTSFMEIPNPSESRILREFKGVIAATRPKRLVIDSINSSLVKLEAVYLRGIPFSTPGFAGVDYSGAVAVEHGHKPLFRDAATWKMATSLEAAWEDQAQRKFRFHLFDPADAGADDPFNINRIGRPKGTDADGCCMLTTCGNLTIVNGRHRSEGKEQTFVIRPWNEISNHLLLTTSQLGGHYFLDLFSHANQPVSLFAHEYDPLVPGVTLQAGGRHLLFEVVHPAPKIRLLLSATVSYRGDGANQLPPASAIGDGRQPFPLLGRGSARVFSPPLTPQRIDDLTYVAVDMGAEAVQNPSHRTGLMALYGKELPMDHRKYVAHFRDVSAASEEEYAALKPPSSVDHFPADLVSQPDLEYSGLYEDGWCSEAFWCGLTQPEGQDAVVVRGMVPLIAEPDFKTEMRLSVDGREVARRTLGLGDFEVVAAAPGGGRRRVEVHFSQFQVLPGGDGRPAVALLKHLGFGEPAGAPAGP
jgi:hypothetical protein